jgi:uncharacterized protein (DUF362 family)
VSEHRVGLARWAGDGPPSYASVPELRALIESAVRQALGAGLGSFVRPGARVLIKPNWVLDVNHSGATMDCLITHLAFVEAMLHEVLACSPARVILGDAPIQSADFDRIVPPAWRERMRQLGRQVPVETLDFRNLITRWRGKALEVVARDRRSDRMALFDLGASSLLEPISSPAGRFRNTNYGPSRLERVQRPGVHQYVICKEPLEADVVINLPKLKSHGKAGVTAALKNLVGINGDKDHLPHHRVGSPDRGGDCYDAPHPAKRATERLLDFANSRIGRPGYPLAAKLASGATRIARRFGLGGLEGAWYGNDTVWRMTLDLNRILRFGLPDGTMTEAPQRPVLTVTDGVIAGEGDGPLAPTPIALGAVTCATSAAYADLVHAELMHFDWRRIPLIARAFEAMRWPLVAGSPEDVEVRTSEGTYRLGHLRSLGRAFRPPRGWRPLAGPDQPERISAYSAR